MTEEQEWRTYEEVATFLLRKMREEFDLEHVEEKQKVPGASGTTWEIDAKGVRDGGTAFIIIECRRHTTRRISQESAGGLAFRILDAGASGGIMVSPLGFQEGAKRVAGHANIIEVRLSSESTEHSYVLQFLNKIFVGVHDEAKASDSHEVQLIRKDKKETD